MVDDSKETASVCGRAFPSDKASSSDWSECGPPVSAPSVSS